MKKKSLKLSALLGTGALCATLIAAPISNSAYANMGAAAPDDAIGRGGSEFDNCSPDVISKLGTTSAELENLKITSRATLSAALAAANGLSDFEKYNNIAIKYQEIINSTEYTNAEKTLADQLRAELKKPAGDNTHIMTLVSDARAILTSADATQGEKDAIATAFNDATVAYKKAAKLLADTIKAQGITIDENLITNYSMSGGSYYTPLIDLVENAALNAGGDQAYQYSRLISVINGIDELRGATAEDLTPYFVDIVCTITKISPNLTINYGDAPNPFATKTAAPTPAVGPTIASTNDSVRVSGKGLDPSYKLDVKEVTDKVKLTGRAFNTSLNQAFFDINVMNGANVKVTNTGEVVVSVKLPTKMNANNSFVIYYIPQNADGTYATDKAEIVAKGAKVENGYIVFTTNHFSTYAIVEYPAGKIPDTGVVANGESSAKAASVQLLAGIATFATTAGTIYIVRRRALSKEA